MKPAAATLGWALFAVLGAVCLAVIALHRGESINALWLVAAALCVFFIGYRFYGRFIGDEIGKASCRERVCMLV